MYYIYIDESAFAVDWQRVWSVLNLPELKELQ